MGIDLCALNLLKHAGKSGPLKATICLGRQGLHIKADVLARRFGARAGWMAEPYAERLMTEVFGASQVESIDNSGYEGATHVHDMNLPLPPGFGAYDTVIDTGTLEHVFDVAQGLRNTVALCGEGGQILHVTPANNFCGHGFWQFSPELFFSLYAPENGFADTEVFIAARKRPHTWFQVRKPTNGRRVNIVNGARLYCVCRTVRADAAKPVANVQQSNYVVHWSAAMDDAGKQARSRTPVARLKASLLHRLHRSVSRFNPNLTRIEVGGG